MAQTALSAYRAGQRSMRSKSHRRGRARIPLAVIGGFVPLGLNVLNGFKTSGINGAGFELVRGTTGYNTQAGAWEWQALVRGMGPVLAGILVHKVANRLGVNGMLARAGLPFGI